MTFLSQLAATIVKNQTIGLKDTLIVLPNKRAKKMLQKELASQIQQATFSPTILAINDFIELLSPIKKWDDFELLVKLYTVYKKKFSTQHDTFQQFLAWGETFLSDINEIDMQLANPADIYSNLADIKEMETSFGKEKLSENQQKYIQFYLHLYPLYVQFNQELAEQNAGYEGAIYKNVAQHIAEYALHHPYKRYIFAGFHTLSPSEMQILEYYHQHREAELFFDLDQFYAETYTPLIKKFRDRLRLQELHWTGNYYATIPKNIEVVGASKAMSQIYYAIEKLNQIEKEQGNLNHTALVFADESLLLPFLHAYDCSQANLTMGYPLSATPTYNLLQTLLETAKNGNRFMEIQGSNQFLHYHKDILTFFRNPLIINHFFQNQEKHTSFINHLIQSNKIFFTNEDFDSQTFHYPLLQGNGKNILHHILHFFQELFARCIENTLDYYTVNLINQQLISATETLNIFEEEESIELSTIEFLLNNKLKHLTIPLKGNPSEGLQIMGLLETRTLDFNNIILLSVNEGILPTGKSSNSLILFDVKLHFGLPTYQYKDSVFAYHFFRLLQRASQIILIYNTDSSSALAEKSRFINQLEFEINLQKLTNISLISKTISILPKQSHSRHPIEIAKTVDIIKKLTNFQYSPSSLSNYINCPLQFYLKNIEKIEPVKDVSENVEKNVIGNVIHKILDVIIQECKQLPFDQFEKIIKEKIAKIEILIIDQFQQEEDIAGQDLSRGRLFLAITIVKQSLVMYLTFLIKEMRETPFEILDTEIQLSHTLNIRNIPIKLTGTADRIDFRNHLITILDYKTGKVDKRFLKCKSIEEIFSDKNYQKLMQLLHYAFLYQHDNSRKTSRKTKDIVCGIIGFEEMHKELSNTLLLPDIPKIEESNELITEEILIEFESCLVQLLEEILDRDLPFRQTENRDHCNYCDFRNICRK